MGTITPTERELEVLKILWENAKTTVRQVWKVMAEQEPELAYTTVLSIFQVMEKKGLVSHETIGKTYHYTPTQARDKTMQSLTTDFLNRVYDGAVGEFLLHGLEAGKITVEEISELETLIEHAKKKSRKSGKKGGRK